MKMPKASDADKDRFRDLIDTVAYIPGLEVKPMGGYTSIPDDVDAAVWTERAASYIAALPPKPKKG